MERLGGLIHRMPQTAFVFLVGCVAISALPPLNGFVSEWLTFQAILLSPQLPSWGLKFLVPAVGALLALSAALAAACFVKRLRRDVPRPAAHGRGRARARDRPLLARRDVRPRRALPARRHPARPRHRCAGAGRAERWSARACRCRPASWLSIVPIAREPQLLQRPARLPVHRGLRRARRPSRSTGSPPTGCAARRPGTAAFPIRARRRNTPPASFAQPIRRVFGTVVFRAREHVDMPPPGDMRAGAAHGRLARSRLGRALRADRRRRRRSPPTGSTTCSS